ncbi:hypothetical protein KL86DPRO_11532 [uncultured delta proteobacterium]|uniref:Uncharacterized protein n=1 Tax=uncultured delta proteobacterium TaxID=34034 RepID=A0A212JIA6_9DELT|nr:hypothetical protein KL86DPRO_11532 [uncultured delta proteobacterium]
MPGQEGRRIRFSRKNSFGGCLWLSVRIFGIGNYCKRVVASFQGGAHLEFDGKKTYCPGMFGPTFLYPRKIHGPHRTENTPDY